jgi:hypothetical protein
MDKAHGLERPNNPLPCCFIAFEFKCGKSSNGSCLNFPESARLIVGTELAIANAIPPTTCFAPTRENCMDTKAFATEGKFDWGKTTIGENFVRWYYVRCC